MEAAKYLEIKNWGKYQSARKGGSEWVKDYTDKDAGDDEYARLTMVQRYMLDACCRLRGRTGKPLANDMLWICRAIAVIPRERHNATSAIQELIRSGFLIPTDQQLNFSEMHRVEKKREEEKREDATAAAPPAEPDQSEPVSGGFTPEDLAPTLLTQIGIGLTGNTAKAAIEAIRVKAQQSGWDPQKACLHIVERAHAYRASPVFRAVGTRFKSWEKWLIEGCYDEPPESWNGSGKKAHVTESGAKIDRGFIPLKKKT